MDNELIVKCEVELDRIFFPKKAHKVESGEFAIFSAKIVNEIGNCNFVADPWGYSYLKLKGNVCKLEYDVTYSVSCKLADVHETYGNTYEILFINRKVDLSDKRKQMDFLEGILNPNIVEKLFEEYDDVISLIENKDIKSLTSIKGIGNSTAMRIIDEYEESKDYSHIYTELKDFKLTSNLIKRLLDFYKSPDTIVDIIKTDPYRLIEVKGIGFKKADEIAQMGGLCKNDTKRVKACLIHLLETEGEQGRSYLHYGELLNLLYNQIGCIEDGVINEVAKEMMDNCEVIVSNEGAFIGLTKYYLLETDIFKELRRLKDSEGKVKPNIIDFNERLKQIEITQGFNFTDEQVETIKLGVNENVLAITGGAGVGKTATVNGIVKLLKDYNISACALSGKASVRITEATGLEASTIHKLLGYQNGSFTYDKFNKLPTDIVIIDESTMINGDIFLSLLESIPSGAKVFMLGDWQQLTPIGNCQVFTDILNSNTIPISKLTKFHRQAQASGIITTSMSIIEQNPIFKSNFEGCSILGELKDMELDIYKNNNTPSDKIVDQFIKHYNDVKNILEVQIAVPMRLRGDLSTYNINTKIQQIINPVNENDDYIEIVVDNKKNDKKSYKIKIGDKVINTKNNYKALTLDGEKIAIFNGNIGIVQSIENGNCIVNFEGIGEVILNKQSVNSLELAYACTIHKLQGSGFERVIVGVDSSAYVLLNAELLYTGLTRAKKYCVLIGQSSAIQMAINTREVKKKQTYLKDLLNQN